MATIPTPVTAVSGAAATAAQFNSLRDAANLLLDPPRMSAKATATQSILNATFTPITLQTEIEDNDAMFTAGGSSVTIKTAGRWLFTYVVPFAANATGGRVAAIYQNGTEVHRHLTNGGSLGPHISAAKILRCALNDVIQLNGYQNSGGSLNTDFIASTGVMAQIDAQWIGK